MFEKCAETLTATSCPLQPRGPLHERHRTTLANISCYWKTSCFTLCMRIIISCLIASESDSEPLIEWGGCGEFREELVNLSGILGRTTLKRDS